MFELLARLAFAFGLLAVALAAGTPTWDLAWRPVLAVPAYAVVAYLFARRGLLNPGLAGFTAVADAAVVAYLLGAVGHLESFGFVVLLPCAYATARHGSNPAAMAPISAAWLLVAHNVTSTSEPTGVLLAQTGAVLVMGLVMNQRRIVMSLDVPVQVPADPTDVREPDGYLELRENFRRLRDHALQLESRSRRDRLTALLLEATATAGNRVEEAIARTLRDATGVEGVALYTVTQCGDAVRVRAISGDVGEPDETEATADSVLAASPRELRAAFADDNRRSRHASVLIQDGGELLGVVRLAQRDADALSAAAAEVTAAAPALAQILAAHRRTKDLRRRLREAEMLYAVASAASGAESATNLCARVADDLFELLELDHVALHLLDEGEEVLAAAKGASARLLEVARFPTGDGARGWVAACAPELVWPDAAEAPFVDRTEALRRRVGSYYVAPIEGLGGPCGYLTAATHAAHRIDEDAVAILRSLVAELGHALARLADGEYSGPALVTPGEFLREAAARGRGHLVTLEPIRRTEAVAAVGTIAFEHALANLARRLRATLPAGSLLCRRQDGELCALVQGADEDEAQAWANEATTTAALIGVRSPDGSRAVPLAVRAKVIDLEQAHRPAEA